jgi:hypothetical protein
MWLMRCPECRAKFNTSKTSGRVRCPECDELFEPDWPDEPPPGPEDGSDERNGVVKLMAKPGYAIGAITAKTGLGIDGLSVTFMGIRGDELDPTDSYESEWVGGTGGGNPTRLTGNGTASDGLLIREGPERVSAVGLKFKSD